MATELDAFPSAYDQAWPLLTPEGVLPSGDYAPSQAEFEERFASSTRRRQILQGWKHHRAALLESGLHPNCRELLNGSYTTAKAEPGDLDLAVEVPTTTEALQRPIDFLPALHLLRGPMMKSEYLCDAYPIFCLPEEDPDYLAVTVAAIRYWTKWFGTSRSGQAKGRVWSSVGAWL